MFRGRYGDSFSTYDLPPSVVIMSSYFGNFRLLRRWYDSIFGSVYMLVNWIDMESFESGMLMLEINRFLPPLFFFPGPFSFFLCVSMCFTIWSLRMNPLPHWTQVNGLLPECRHICRRKSVLWLKAFGHCSHLNGFSPECFATCSSCVAPHGNRLPHLWHLKGLSPQWNVLLCWVK